MNYSKRFFYCMLPALFFVMGISCAGLAGVQAWLTTDTAKVFPDTPAPRKLDELYMIDAVRNEYAPFQLALRSDTAVNEVSVSLSDMKGPGAGIATELLLVETVTTERPSMENETRHVWPDPLPPYHDFDLEAGKTRSVWFDMFIPQDAAAGEYSGTITVSAAGEKIQRKIVLNVHDIAISTIPHLNTAFGWGKGDVANAHHVAADSPEHKELMDKYYWFLVAHRLSPYFIPVDLFSEEAHKYLDDPRINFLRAPFSWDETEMRRIYERLRDTGWIKKAYYYQVDEPDRDEYDKINKIGQWLHSFSEDLQVLLTYRYVPELEPAHIKVWCPVILYTIAPIDIANLKRQQKLGKEYWWYTCIQPKWPGTTYFIDDLATGPRLHPWMNRIYGVTGILYWKTNAWGKVDYNPWEKTETYPLGNGDGSLLYPGYQVGHFGPVASQRIKMLREGMEDYELQYVLKEELEKAAENIGPEAAEYNADTRLFEHSYALISEEGRNNTLGEKTPYFSYSTRDYHDIEAQRRVIIREILQTRQNPPLLVSTDPVEHGYTPRDEARVQGFAPQGASITVNGVQPMIKGAQFRAKVPLQKGANTISVTVEHNGLTKTVTRTVYRK